MRGRSLNIVSEPGLYSLVLRSRKPEARCSSAGSRTTSSQRFASLVATPRASSRSENVRRRSWPPRRWPSRGERKDARIAGAEPAAAFTTELVAAAGDFDVRAADPQPRPQHPHGRGTPVRVPARRGLDRSRQPSVPASRRRRLPRRAHAPVAQRQDRPVRCRPPGAHHRSRASVTPTASCAAPHRSCSRRRPSCFRGTHDHAAAGLHGRCDRGSSATPAARATRRAWRTWGHSPCYQSPEAKGCATCKHLVPGLRGGMEGPDRPARRRLYGEDPTRTGATATGGSYVV